MRAYELFQNVRQACIGDIKTTTGDRQPASTTQYSPKRSGATERPKAASSIALTLCECPVTDTSRAARDAHHFV